MMASVRTAAMISKLARRGMELSCIEVLFLSHRRDKQAVSSPLLPLLLVSSSQINSGVALIITSEQRKSIGLVL
jgi:hypothetical protein